MGSVGRNAIGEPALVVLAEGVEGEEWGDGLGKGFLERMGEMDGVGSMRSRRKRVLVGIYENRGLVCIHVGYIYL